MQINISANSLLFLQPNLKQMILPEQALKIVLGTALVTGTEKVDLLHGLGRALAEDVISDMDMPPFDKSAMDGFACRMSELGNELEIIETIAAGQQPYKTIGPKQCSRIMTGARVPEGADCVIKVEETTITSEGKVRFTGSITNPNIAYQREDMKRGETVLTNGTFLKPHHIAVLASVGCYRPLVYQRPRVAIISTGNEIVEPWEKPGPSQIRNSNSYQLYGQVLQAGAQPEYIGIAPDDEQASFDILSKALKDNDIILLTGGVSMGDFDFIPGVLQQLGVTIHFRTVAIQPGKPTVFGTLNKKRVFGLPGNPVSSYNIFILLVQPLIRAMLGGTFRAVPSKLPLGIGYSRKKSERMSWIPVKVSDEGTIIPLEYHGSAHVCSLTAADAIACIPAGVNELNTGDWLDVRFI
jgi:molybdopterin molybdotransferase